MAEDQIYEFRPDVECLYEHDMTRMYQYYKPTGPHVHLIIDDEDWLSFFYDIIELFPTNPPLQTLILDDRLLFEAPEHLKQGLIPSIEPVELSQPLAEHVVLCNMDPSQLITDFSKFSSWAKTSIIFYSSTKKRVTQLFWVQKPGLKLPEWLHQPDLNRLLGTFLTETQDKNIRKLPPFCVSPVFTRPSC